MAAIDRFFSYEVSAQWLAQPVGGLEDDVTRLGQCVLTRETVKLAVTWVLGSGWHPSV